MYCSSFYGVIIKQKSEMFFLYLGEKSKYDNKHRAHNRVKPKNIVNNEKNYFQYNIYPISVSYLLLVSPF